MIYDVGIIGGASAGLTAAIYTARKKLNTIILTKQIGGQSLLTDSIENFPGFEQISGAEMIEKIRAQAEKYNNVDIKEDAIVEKISKTENIFTLSLIGGEIIQVRSVIIATGRSPRRLDVPGEKEFEKKGVTFCAICDAPFFEGKDVAVAGSGNSGLKSALDLIKYANKVYVLEYGDRIMGDEIMQEELRRSGKVEFILNVKIRELAGGNFMEKIIFQNRESEEKTELAVSGIFINVGWSPATGFLKGFVGLNNQGEVIVDHKTGQASVSGVFAAGDVADSKYKQCVIAAGEGATAALSAYEYLSGRL